MDRLNKPIEYICATYSFEALQKLLPHLNSEFNIAAVADELAMRLSSELEETNSTFDDWLAEQDWDYNG